MTDEADPKGLIRESYRIEGIGASECRSIFVDWALSLGPTLTPRAAIALLIARYGAANPGHPMNAVLSEGLETPPEPRRRGGRAARIAN